MQGNRAVRRDLKVLQRHASRFAADVNRLGNHLAHTMDTDAEESAEHAAGRWRELPKVTTENLRQLALQTRKQLDALSEQTKRQARAVDVQVHNRPYRFVTGSFLGGIAAGALLSLALRRK